MRGTAIQFDAVLFDLDNTVADRVAAVRRLAGKLYDAEAGLRGRLPRDRAIKLFEEIDGDGLVFDKVQLFRDVSEAWGGLSKPPEALAAWLQTAYPESYEPVPEVHSFLAELSGSGIPWGIITNGPAFQRTKVRQLGLDKMTDCIVISSEADVRKPHPEIFRIGLENLGVGTPEMALFAGDSPESDIAGAGSAGMKTAWVRRGRTWPPEMKAPDIQIDQLYELGPVLGLR